MKTMECQSRETSHADEPHLERMKKYQKHLRISACITYITLRPCRINPCQESYRPRDSQNLAIINAFTEIDRRLCPEPHRDQAYADAPLPIGAEQTISQPSTVAFMLELLEPHAGQTILDVGAGSGWTTALLAQVAGPHGHVYGVEIIDELVDFGRSNLANYSLQASIQKSGAALGLPERAPFDRILVSAATDRFPDELFTQLANEGIMVLVIRDAVVRLQKFPGFAFVPLKR